MAMSKSVSVGSIVTGCLLLVLTLISVIFGCVVLSKEPTNATLGSLGLWALYFVVPGVISIRAGIKKHSSLLIIALGTNILGIILAISGVVTGAIFWERLSCDNRTRFDRNFNICHYYGLKGSDLETVRSLTGIAALIFAFSVVVTLIGLHCGCTGIFWAKELDMTVRTAQPSSMIMTIQSYPPYNQPPPPYSPHEVVVDTKAKH